MSLIAHFTAGELPGTIAIFLLGIVAGVAIVARPGDKAAVAVLTACAVLAGSALIVFP